MVTFTIVDYWQYDYKFQAQNELMEVTEKYPKRKEKTYKYYDKVFKKILDDKNEFAKLVNNNLEFDEFQERIKAEEIEKYNIEFITRGLEIENIDMIYKQKNRNVFIIVKYQNTIDYNMAEKMTKYCVAIIRSIYKKETADQIYPIICPIVLYTGEKKWDAKTTIGKLEEEYYGFPPLEYPKYNLIEINKL